MTRYFKCVRPDGRDFHSGTVDYAAALASGELVTHHAPHRGNPSGYLSVSVSPSDCTGMKWPCRLFEVEPDDPWAPEAAMLPSKRACHSLRVVRELPAHEALGPQGVHVAALIDRARSLTDDEAGRLAAAQEASWDYDAARAAAAQAVARAADRTAADQASGQAATWADDQAIAWVAAWDAVRALVVRDLLDTNHYDTLTQPWASVIGKVHPDD